MTLFISDVTHTSVSLSKSANEIGDQGAIEFGTALKELKQLSNMNLDLR